MTALRFVSNTSRRIVATRAPLGRRGYAEANDKLSLSLVLPYKVLYNSEDVSQVNVPAATGDMGILANHVPSVEALRPGLVEVIEAGNNTKKWFIVQLMDWSFSVSAGFATVHPNNKLTINAVEAAELDTFSPETVRSNLAEAQRVVAGNGTEEDKMEARIEVDVYEALQHALGQK